MFSFRFSCALERINNLRNAHLVRVNFAMYSYLMFAYRPYFPIPPA